jgi:hypothetical protein
MRYNLWTLEINMGLALRKEDFDQLVPPPPAMDWSAAFAAVQNLNDFRRLVDSFEAGTRTWLVGLNGHLQSGIAEIEARIAGVPEADVRKALLPLLDTAIGAIMESIEAHAVPFHEEGEAKDAFARLRRMPGPAAKFLRKQINRIEDIRIKRHNALVDIYYGLLAFRSEFEEDRGNRETFSDPKSLGDFLRKQVA